MPGHGQFGGTEHPKRLPYSHHGFQFYPPGHCRSRHSHFLSAQRPTERRYRLELSDDPGGLRPLVPPHPGFPSEAHDGFPPCRRPPARHTFDNPLPPVERTGYRFSHLTGSPLAETGRGGRVRVAHLHLEMSKSRLDRTGEFHPRAPVATGRARLKASGYSNRSGGAG